MSAPDVLGVAEVAELLGIDSERARTITCRRSFPEPCARLTLGRVWYAEDVKRWIAEHPDAVSPRA